MKLSIKNVGPLKDAELELGDITVLLGPPNSGKSYTLKSLYAQLVMLDETARDHIVKDAVKEMEILDNINYFIKTVAPRTLIAVVALHGHMTSENAEETIRRLKEKVGVEEIDIKIEDEELIVTLQDSEIMDAVTLTSLLDEKLSSVLRELLPTTEETEITIAGTSIPGFSSLLSEAFRTPLEGEVVGSDDRIGVRSILRASLRLEEKSVKISTRIETQLKLNSPLWRDIKRDVEMLLTKTKAKKDEKGIVDIILESIFERGVPKTRVLPPLEWRLRTVFRDLSRSLSSFIWWEFISPLEEQLKNIYEETFNLQSALFIPFGRSPFVYQLDTVSNDPSLWRDLIEIYRENLPFYSYIHHLNKGRSRLLGDKFNEELVKVFSPVLQGEITFDKTTKKLRYKKWGSIDVPITHASALAGEVSGILLPILSLSPDSCLIMEEPEAQLHYSAQILMALVLAGLSKEFNHKVIFSTHSDVLAITLAYLKELDYGEDAIARLIQELLKVQGIEVGDENVMPLAKAVSQAKDLDIRFYYYEPKPDGTVEVLEKPAEDILREVPGITVITDILASWALSL